MSPTYTLRAVELAADLNTSGWADSVTTRTDTTGAPVIADVCAHGLRFILTTQTDGDAPTGDLLIYSVYDDTDPHLTDLLATDGLELTGDTQTDIEALTTALDRY